MRDLGLQQWFENKNKRFDTKINKKSDCTGGRVSDAVRYCQSEQIISIYYEESNVSIWNETGGHQDVSPGERVPEVS